MSTEKPSTGLPPFSSVPPRPTQTASTAKPAPASRPAPASPTAKATSAPTKSEIEEMKKVLLSARPLPRTNATPAPVSNLTPEAVGSTSLAEAIKTVRIQSSALNKLTNEAARLVEKVEAFLNDECSVGIPAYVAVRTYHDDADPLYSPETQYLGYCRLNGKFRIVIAYEDGTGPDGPSKAWAECRRDEKLETIEKLPELIAKIAEEVAKNVSETEGKLKVVADALSFLKS